MTENKNKFISSLPSIKRLAFIFVNPGSLLPVIALPEMPIQDFTILALFRLIVVFILFRLLRFCDNLVEIFWAVVSSLVTEIHAFLIFELFFDLRPASSLVVLKPGFVEGCLLEVSLLPVPYVVPEPRVTWRHQFP